jgi:hypothetical protein
MFGKCSIHRENQKCVQILVGKPERESSVGRPRHIEKVNVKMDVKETGFGLDSAGSE